MMKIMTNYVGQAQRHQPGDDDDDDEDDDEGDEEEDNMPKRHQPDDNEDDDDTDKQCWSGPKAPTCCGLHRHGQGRWHQPRHGVLFTIRTWPRVFVAASHQQNQLSIRQMTTHGKAR